VREERNGSFRIVLNTIPPDLKQLINSLGASRFTKPGAS